MRKFFFISPPRLPFPVIFSSPALIPLTSLVTRLSRAFSPFSPPFKTTTPFNKILTSLFYHPHTIPSRIPLNYPHLLSTPSPLSIGTLPFHALLFLSHQTFTTYSTLHSSFPPRFTSSFSPHLSHPIHAKTQRAPKTRTMHKSINPPLHFNRFTFLRFYIITEVSQIKFPHHHPRCTVNTVLKTNPAFCLVPYSLHPPKTALHQAQQIKPYPEYSSSSLLLQIAPFYGITE